MKLKFAEAFYLPILFIFLLTGRAVAGKYSYNFSSIGIADGLSQSTIMCMIQDKKGFIWVGTLDGLNKYDGYNFTVYSNNQSDPYSLSDNAIMSLLEDREGFIWAGSLNGVLNKFDRRTEKFYHYYLFKGDEKIEEPRDEYDKYPITFSRNQSRTITSIMDDHQGHLWIGTWGQGLIKFNKASGSIEHFYNSKKNAQSLSHNRVLKIARDIYGNIWIATLGGGIDRLYSRRSGKKVETCFVRYMHDSKNPMSLSSDRVMSLLADRSGNLWVGTFDTGLNKMRIEPGSSKSAFTRYCHFAVLPFSIADNSVMDLTEDREGYIWAGTFGGGLSRMNPNDGRALNFRHNPFDPNSIADNDVLSLCMDRSGILWIGTHVGKGISKLSVNLIKFGLIKYEMNGKSGLNDGVVWAIHEDRDGLLWIGTYRGGLNMYSRKNGTFKSYRLSDNHIRAIAEDKSGNLWIGTYSGGLNMFNKKTGAFRAYKFDRNDPNSIGCNQIQAVYIDSKNRFWIGTFGGGLNMFEPGDIHGKKIKFTRFVHDQDNPNSISSDRVYSIYEDRHGNLWIATIGGGLNRFDRKTGKFHAYRNNPLDPYSISDDKITAVFGDKDSYLWVGTYGGGLNKFDPKTGRFYRYDRKNGLKSHVVYGLLSDDRGGLWMSTDNGLAELNTNSGHITSYDLQDGLQSMEFSGGAYFKDKNGIMFFGGINGVNYFNPALIKTNPNVPPIVITTIRVFNKAIKGEKKEIVLSRDENFFSVEFAALDYANARNNRYAYMLEGFDKDWHYVESNQRFANYTNLAPGRYRFRVIGSNNDGLWNRQGAVLSIYIKPSYYQSWWFLCLMVILSGSAVFSLVKMRFRHNSQIEDIKAKLAADLHDNVGSGLTEISILSELIKQDIGTTSESVNIKLAKISEKARLLVDSMSDIVWMINPRRDSLHDLIIRIKDSYSDLLGYVGISFKTSNLEKLGNIRLPMDYRQNLFLLFKEGINNSIKHSNCKKISLQAKLRGDVLEMTLSDDGIGIDREHITYGNGIKNIESRAEAIGGRLIWKSNMETGTMIRFVGRINKINKMMYFIDKFFRSIKFRKI